MSEEESRKRQLKERFETCPACGYENGFHMILMQDTQTHPSEVVSSSNVPAVRSL